MKWENLVKDLRIKLLLSQEEMAKKLGIAFCTLNRYENGHFEPTYKVQRKLKQLDIVFENCEIFSIKPQDIVILSLQDLSKDIVINGFQYEDGEECLFDTCKECVLVLNQNGLKTLGGFDEEKITLEERLQYKDITHLDLIYENGENNYISVPWEDCGDNQYMNKYQNNLYTTDMEDNEVLEIIIKQDLTIGELEEYGI